jgi:hypothetical protein
MRIKSAYQLIIKLVGIKIPQSVLCKNLRKQFSKNRLKINWGIDMLPNFPTMSKCFHVTIFYNPWNTDFTAFSVLARLFQSI